MKNLLRNLAYASMIVASLTVAAHHLRGEATAQSPMGSIAGITYDGNTNRILVLLENGDLYRRLAPNPSFTDPAEYVGNYFDGAGPTAAESRSWGQIKAGR